MSSDAPIEAPVAITTRGLSKAYRVFARPPDRLKQMLFGRWGPFYREFHAVRDVDLTIHRGETVGVVGRNGSGKSTLLKLLCGLVAPSAGTVEVRGHVAPILALGVGFHPDATGRENVSMNAAVLGISSEALADRLESIIAFADIGEFFDQPVRSYSSGMVSRLAFAVAIHADPDILVIDEILSVGDEAFSRKCYARIEALKRQGSTILFVSHASNLVVQLCDRAILMEAGRRVLTADPKTVVALYHKLLYAPPERRSGILAEIQGWTRSSGAVSDPEPSALPGDRAAFGTFDPELVPKSTVEYPRSGARIRRPRLLNGRGDVVNVLRPGATYTYAYDVEFAEPAFGVRFGMMVKTLSGYELAGQVSHAWGGAIDVVDAGTRATVHFPLAALMVPGAYFLNAGVLGLTSDGEQYLHRIVDAAMFRIEAEPGSRVTGQIDLSSALEPRVELSRCDAPAGVAAEKHDG